MKYQQPRLWVHLSIESSTGYSTACRRHRSVTANSHNPPRTPKWRRKKPPVWRQMEMTKGGFIVLCAELGGHIRPTCQEDGMWWQEGKIKGGMHIYLWGMVATSDTLAVRLQDLVKMMQFGVTPLWNKPLFEMEVYICASEDRGSDTSICYSSCKDAQRHTVAVIRSNFSISQL